MSSEDDRWADALAAVPGPDDVPMTGPAIRARFPEPRPSLKWLKRHLGSLDEAGDVEMFGLGLEYRRRADPDNWLHYRWSRRFVRQLGLDD